MKSPSIWTLTVAAALAGVTLLGAGAVRADDDGERFRLADPQYREECGGCHVAYPPQLLSAASWREVMAGLTRHFGSDASLEAPTTAALSSYLQANAGRRDSSGRDGRPLLRITETAWFRKEHRDGHDGLTSAMFSSAEVKSAANCAACHRGAGEGDYGERGIRLPAMASRR